MTDMDKIKKQTKGARDTVEYCSKNNMDYTILQESMVLISTTDFMRVVKKTERQKNKIKTLQSFVRSLKKLLKELG